MRTVKLSLAAASVAITLFALVGVASANDLSVSGRGMTATWTRAELTGGFGTAACAMTMEGSLHTQTTTKTAGALIGFITRASVGPCAIGSATVLKATLPWHVQYSSYTGLLPGISSVITHVIGAQWSIREPVFAITCLFTTTEAQPNTVTFELSSGHVAGATLGGTIESSCGITGRAGGTSATNSALTITLI